MRRADGDGNGARHLRQGLAHGTRAALALLWLGVAAPSLTNPAAADPAGDLQALLQTPGPGPALALAEVGLDALPQITEALQADSDAAPLMAWALCRHAVSGTRPALEALLPSTDQRAGYWAALALGRLGDAAAGAALAALLSSPADAPQQYWEIATRGPEGWVSMFERRYENGQVVIPPAPPGAPNLRVAYAALEALGQLGGAEAEQALVPRLASAQWLIRYGAARGLGTMHAAHAVPLLQDLADHDPTLVVRTAAQQALRRIAGTEPPPPARPPLSIPAIAFIKARARTESSLGFEDSYPYPTMPWTHWGENIYTLAPPRPDGELRNITNFRNCRVQGLEVSYDGRRLLFARCDDDRRTGFHVCEINADGTGLRQLTDGNCNDVDPCYLPDGRIMFVSDRSGHQEYYHQERSRNLYVMQPDGSSIERVTFNPNQDYDPLVLADGRIAYTSYRFYGQDGSGDIYHRGSDLNRIETQLRTINPAGTGDALLYGAMRGGFYVPLRPMPDSLQDSGASYVRGGDQHIGVSVSWVRELADRSLVCVTPAGLTLLRPEVDPLACEVPVFPEVVNLAGGEQVYIYSHDELNPIGRYTSPYPADEGRLFVAYAPWYDTSWAAYGLYLFDLATRELTLIHDEPGVSDVDPVPLAPRPVPPRLEPNAPPRDQPTGTVLCLSVFNSDLEYDRAAVRYVRVVGVTLMGLSINANAAFESHVLGTVPVQSDGSFLVEVPADRPVRFQLLDAEGNVLLHETEFNCVRGGEALTCAGCHEPKGRTPLPTRPLAAAQPAYPCLETVGDLVYHGRVHRSYNWLSRP